MAWLHSCMFARGTFPIVLVTHYDRRYPSSLIGTLYLRYFVILTSKLILDTIGLAIESIHCPDEHIIGNIVQVSTEAQPRPCHGYMVGGTFALCFDQQFGSCDIFSIPRSKRRQELQAVGGRGYHDFYITTIFGRCLITWIIYSKAFGWEFFSVRWLELHLLAFVIGKRIGKRVKVQASCNGQHSHHLWRGYKSMGIGVSIGTLREVTVEGVYDGVFLLLISTFSVPLTDTRAASVGKYLGAELFESIYDTIALDGVTNLFGAWVDTKGGLRRYAQLNGLLNHRYSAAQILIGRVGTRAYQAPFYLERPIIFTGYFLHLAHWRTTVRSERPIDIRF